MPRMNANRTVMQEQLEGAQSCLGNARAYMDLVYIRMRLAAASQPHLLMPAMVDPANAQGLIQRSQAQGLIQRSQAQITAVTPVCARADSG